MIKGTLKAISLTRSPNRHEIEALRAYVREGIPLPHDFPVLVEYPTIKNLTPLTGRMAIARRLSGDDTYNGYPNYLALGSGTTPFTDASTQLNTEVFRKLLTDVGYLSNVSYADCVIESGDVSDQTFEEAAIFIGGTASANTGIALSLLITGGWTKSGSIFISFSKTLT